MRRVFLVDDEALALRRLTRMLEATGRVEIVGQTTDPEAAIEAITGATGLDLGFSISRCRGWTASRSARGCRPA